MWLDRDHTLSFVKFEINEPYLYFEIFKISFASLWRFQKFQKISSINLWAATDKTFFFICFCLTLNLIGLLYIQLIDVVLDSINIHYEIQRIIAYRDGRWSVICYRLFGTDFLYYIKITRKGNRLVPVLRLLNPRAEMSCFNHAVCSQRLLDDVTRI